MRHLGIALLVVALVALTIVAVMVWCHIRDVKWRHAIDNPRWEMYKTNIGHHIEIGIRHVAKVGRSKRVLRYGDKRRIDRYDHDHLTQVYMAETEFRQFADTLNDTP